MASPSPTTIRGTRREALRRLGKQRCSSTSSSTPPQRPPSPNENALPVDTPAMLVTSSAPPSTTHHPSPLSPKNGQTTPLTNRIRQDILKSDDTKPMAASTPPLSSNGRTRRERLARHGHLLGARRKSIPPTPQRTNQVSVSSIEKQGTRSFFTDDNNKTPQQRTPLDGTGVTTRTNVSSQNLSAPSTTQNEKPSEEDARRVRERRARGAKKLFILATSPSTEDKVGNMTPLEFHLSTHQKDSLYHDCPSVCSAGTTISSITTLSASLARDRRKFSRDRRYSASRLYARATASVEEKTDHHVAVGGSKTEEAPVRNSNKLIPNQQKPVMHVPPRGHSPVTPDPASKGTTLDANNSIARSLPRSQSTRSRSLSRRRARSRSLSRSRFSPTPSPSTPDKQTATNGKATFLSDKDKTPARSNQRPRGRSPPTLPHRNSDSDGTKTTSTHVESDATKKSSPKKTMGSNSIARKGLTRANSSPTLHSPDADSEDTISASRRRSASVQRARRALARAKPKLGSPTPQLEKSAPKPTVKTTPPYLAREKVEAVARSLCPSPQTRRVLDRRTARLQYSRTVSADIAKHQEVKPSPKHFVGKNLHRRSSQNGVSIFIRKRPLLDYEIERGDYDVVFTECREDLDAIVVHSCNMGTDMKKMIVKPTAFTCSAAFDETCSNDLLYSLVAKPMVKLASNAGLATILTYGGTGSGKTHTLSGMEERLTKDIFRMVHTNAQQVKIHFIELVGERCVDLLGDRYVKLVDRDDGSVEFRHAVSVDVQSAEELHEAIIRGKRKRETLVEGKNKGSNHSHAVIQITIEHKRNKKLRGVLTLVDCVGSERRHNSVYHTLERQKESAMINSSLHALEECIRARASGKEQDPAVPYRSSSLTRILRECLQRKGNAQLCVVATVAPNATETELTMETLKTVTNLAGADTAMEEMKAHEVAVGALAKKKPDPVAPKLWDRGQLIEWMGRKGFLEKDLPDHLDGKLIMRMSRIQLKNVIFEGDDSGEKADRLFNALRAENEKATKAQLERRIAVSSMYHAMNNTGEI